MVPNNRPRQNFHVSKWQVVGVIITCIGVLWSITWGLYTRFGPEAPSKNNASLLAISGSGQQGGNSLSLTPTPIARSIIVLAVPLASTTPPTPMALPTPSDVVPTSTSVQASCYSSSCDGLDPGKNGCVPDQTLAYSTDLYDSQVKVATVEFYVSQVCAAGWVNIEMPSGMTGTLSAQINNGAYVQKYCYPFCPVQLNGQPGRGNVHTVMIHTSQTYNIWGRGCYFPQFSNVICFPQADTGEYGFQGSWPS